MIFWKKNNTNRDNIVVTTKTCTVCQGSGKIPTTVSVYNKNISNDYNKCKSCKGTGQVKDIREKV